MKKTLLLSSIAFGLLLSTTAIQAETVTHKPNKTKVNTHKDVKLDSAGLHDSVGVVEEKALNSGHVKGEKSAKVAVKKTVEKDFNETIAIPKTSNAFENDDVKDEKDVATSAQIKTINAEDKHNPYD